MRLYRLVARLMTLGVPFVVENVIPYYDPPIDFRSRVCRHALWTNLPLPPELPCPLSKSYWSVASDVRSLAEYHDVVDALPLLKSIFGSMKELRPHLRNMVHWRIAKVIASHVIPLVLRGASLQTVLEGWM